MFLILYGFSPCGMERSLLVSKKTRFRDETEYANFSAEICIKSLMRPSKKQHPNRADNFVPIGISF